MNRQAVAQLVEELKADPRYAGISVADEVRRCQLWGCGGKAPTRKRITRWLDREAARHPAKPLDPRPPC